MVENGNRASNNQPSVPSDDQTFCRSESSHFPAHSLHFFVPEPFVAKNGALASCSDTKNGLMLQIFCSLTSLIVVMKPLWSVGLDWV